MAIRTLDVAAIRKDFPIFETGIAYLDSANTSQRPRQVTGAMLEYFEKFNSNIHRAAYRIAEEATVRYEATREKVRAFINAADTKEIVFTRGTTEAINLVAQSYGRSRFKAGDEILVTEMEHHSNIVPWQLLCEQTGARLRVAPIDDAGVLRMDKLEALVNPRTRLVAVAHVSNALGTVNPVRGIIELAHAVGAPVLVDGAQAAPHLKVDVSALDCDFYTFSGHKLYGPTGIGVLYGKFALLDAMPPYQGGGDMISRVTFEKTSYNAVPFKFEAGTPKIAGTIRLSAALHYVQGHGLAHIA